MGWLDSALNDPVGLVMTGVGVFTGNPALIMAGAAHMNAANEAVKAKNAAKDAANNSATARTQQIQSATAVARLGWGRSRMSGPIAYAQSTGTKNEFLHHVTPLCIGPIDAIESVMINDNVLPAENVTTGMVDSGDYYTPDTKQTRARRVGSGTITAVGAVTRILSAVYHTNISSPDSDSRSNRAVKCIATFSGTTINVTGAPAPNTVDVRYEYIGGRGLIRVKKSLGPTSNTAYSDLVTESGGKWTAAHKLNGVASIYVRQEWQSDYFAQIGMGSWSAIGRWRKVYDPRENAALWSCDLSNATAWRTDAASTSVTINATTDPDGAMTADKVVETAVTGVHTRFQSFSLAAGTHTWSIYAKSAERSRIKLSLATAAIAIGVAAEFDLASGTCLAPSAVGGATNEGAWIENAGGGWYRCIVQCTFSAAGTMYGAMSLMTAPGVTSYTGVVGSGVYLWGASKTGADLKSHALTTTAAQLPVTAWSSNPALCIADYMTTSSTSGGLGVPLSDINLNDLTRSADICDQMVQIDAAGTLQKRYELHGDITTDMTPADIMRAMCDTMGGQIPIWTQGKWSILAAAYSPPCAVITEDMLAGDSIEVMPAVPRSSLINRVSIKYTEPGKNYSIVEAPPASSPTYLASDGGIDLPVEMQVNLCQSQHQANRLAWIKLNRARMGFTVQMTCNMYAYNIGMGRTVAVTSSTMGWSANEFEVIGRTFNPLKLTVTYTLKATAASIYAWSYTGMTAIDLTPSTTLPNPLAQPAALASLAAVSGTDQLVRLGDGTFVTRALVTWAQPSESLVVSGGHIDVEWAQPNRDAWQQLPQTPGAITSAYIGPLSDTGVIIIRARSVNSAGRAGLWATIEHTVVGQTQPPSDVTGLTSAAVMGGVNVSWTRPTDVDYMRTELRVGATWAAGAVIDKGNGADGFFWQQQTAGSYTVWAAHVDRTGNYSMNPASIAVAIGITSLVQTSSIAAGSISAHNYITVSYSSAVNTPQVPVGTQVLSGTINKSDTASALVVSINANTALSLRGPSASFPAGVNYFLQSSTHVKLYSAAGALLATDSTVNQERFDIKSLADAQGGIYGGQTYGFDVARQVIYSGAYTGNINVYAEIAYIVYDSVTGAMNTSSIGIVNTIFTGTASEFKR